MTASKKLILFTSALILTAAVVARFECNHSPTQKSDTGWVPYTSANAHLSFEYPSGWNVQTDIALSAISLGASSTSLNYTSLLICPSGTALLMEPKAGLNNCIEFFTQATLLYPPDVGDGFNIFFNVKAFITDPVIAHYDHFHIVTYDSTTSRSPVINLQGLYRNHADFVALDQPLCAQNLDSDCVAMFQHVLDSISFF
jgi:hypothetical protein